MTTRAKIKKIQSINVKQFNTWQITECLSYPMILIVDYERTFPLHITSVSHLSLGEENKHVHEVTCFGRFG